MGFRGLGPKLFNPRKPKKWHLKWWVLADQYGYVYHFEFYHPRVMKAQCKINGTKLSIEVLRRAIDTLLTEGFEIYVDNYYGSLEAIALAIQKHQHMTCLCKEKRPSFLFANRLFPALEITAKSSFKAKKNAMKGKQNDSKEEEETEDTEDAQLDGTGVSQSDNAAFNILTTPMERTTPNEQLLDSSIPPLNSEVKTIGSNEVRVFCLNKSGLADFAITYHPTHNVFASTWLDKKPVNVISTHLGSTTCIVERTHSRTGRRKKIRKGIAQWRYSRYMGGVDRADQKVEGCSLKFRHFSWRRARFCMMIRYWCINAWILHQNLTKTTCSQSHFLRSAADQWTRPYEVAKQTREKKLKAERDRRYYLKRKQESRV